jgi:hypothetical protein
MTRAQKLGVMPGNDGADYVAKILTHLTLLFPLPHV